MPTGTCRYPHHHSGPSAGPPLGLVTLVLLGAVIDVYWHTVMVCLIVGAVLVAAAVPVVLLLHNHNSGYDPELERQALLEQQRQAVAREAARQQLAAPVVHQHLHLHGADAAAVAAAIEQRRHAATVDPLLFPEPYAAVTRIPEED